VSDNGHKEKGCQETSKEEEEISWLEW